MRIFQFTWVLVIAFFVAFSTIMGILGDWLWFASVGYEPVFLKVLFTSFAIGALSFLAFFAFANGSILMARRAAIGRRGKKRSDKTGTRIMSLFVSLIALGVGISMGGSWEVVLKYMEHTPFGVSDPVFGMDVGFYVFVLPFYEMVIGFLFTLFVVSAIFSAITYALNSSGFRIEVEQAGEEDVAAEAGPGYMNFRWSGGSFGRFLPQLSALLFLIFITIAAAIWFSRYGMLFSSSGAVFGAGYTDINVTLPMLTLMSAVSVISGFLLLANAKLGKTRLVVYAIAALILISFAGSVAAGATQALVVKPDEFNFEQPYLERNIQGTLAAYGLDSIQRSIFSINNTLTASDIRANDATLGNVRLWDWRPLKQTYNQLQLFRTYYEFNDVDVDRYDIDGEYKQVLVSAREMNTAELPSQAQTWVNEHLVYTHGYGVVMNPVDKVSGEGLPLFYLKDIPPESPFITLDQMRIYFGEMAGNYVITGTSTEEFDYPSGDENIYTSYSGSGGVPIPDFLSRLIYSMKFGSVELLVSGSLTPQSRLLMNRDVGERVYEIAPFLHYDPDPYVVAAGGRLFWMVDAYTATGMYPYSEPFLTRGERLNYIRNSVKVVVDAYDGTVSYYVVDPDDPIITTYMKMFPGLFQDFGQMPEELRKHVRYPEGLFRIQADIYSTYHMEDPRVFYNKEDVWNTPDEIYRGSRQPMEPYYIIMKLPGEERSEFILMIPFTPRGKENLIGWMAARSDVPNYGKVTVYQFSKQELTYGPMQIEARIDQDTDISQLITLWSQAGSSVVRGNTLVIPIENSILYVEPLYLEATERGTLPQLQRVIVAYGDRLTMQPTLSGALDVIFGEGAAPADTGTGAQPPGIPADAEERISRIAELYDKAQEALGKGDLGLYQQYVDQIGQLLDDR